MPGSTKLSTAEARRPLVIRAATSTFARAGYKATTVADVAAEAKISSAYVFKLFPGKEALFVAALEDCYERILEALAAGVEQAADRTPDGVLDAMGGAYAELIADRDLLLLQVHAQSAAEVPEIGAALRRGYARVVEFASSRSGATDAAVQRFIAFGQLCHLVVTLGIEDSTEPWAVLLGAGLRHPAFGDAAH
ncbi:TetR/AcrR family transcriptional regulator [Agromyces aurantiacus]|uniref:TetR/AcrR family transcriptional regulator n=1 Tax=Agromyces aurantiacus TaxID=165814 RepID=A0ABV9R248_9MICO|nr:helix-turn-helix domain-containing protein [Agromyces aurantiacus]MBM7505881.1 AcrR family transcriptional regulator [Agromyces aurantiacus]